MHFHTIYENESIVLLNRFLHSAISLSPMHSFSYIVWKWINRFAESFLSFSKFSFFPFLHFHTIYENESIVLLNRFLHSAISLSSMHAISYIVWKWINRFAGSFFAFSKFICSYVCIFILYMKTSQSFCWIDFYIQLFLFLLCMHFYTIYEMESIVLLNRFLHSANSFAPMHAFSYDIRNRVNHFAGSIFAFSYFSFSYVFFFLESIILLNRFYHSANSVSHVCTFIPYMKMNQSFCWIVFCIQQIHLLLCIFFSQVNHFAESIFTFSKFIFFYAFTSILHMKTNQSICWIIFIIQLFHFLVHSFSCIIWKSSKSTYWILFFFFDFRSCVCAYVYE